METKSCIESGKTKQKAQLIKGEFTPSDAAYIIMALLDQKINFHKIQRHKKWEEDHNLKTNDINDRIDQLRQSKEMARAFIANAKKRHATIKINGVIEMIMVEHNS